MASKAEKTLIERMRASGGGRALGDLLMGGPSEKARAIVGAPLAAAGAAPFKAVGGGVGGLLFGKRNKNPLSPMFGKRMHGVSGGPHKGGMVPISADEYKRILSGEQAGKVYEGKVGGKTAYFKRKYMPGGLVGFARRHPLLAGGGGLLAYYLASSPGVRAAGKSMMPNFGTDKVHPAVSAQWSEPLQQPKSGGAWG